MSHAQYVAVKTRYHWTDVEVAGLVVAHKDGEDVYAVTDAPRAAVDAKLIALGLAEKPRKPTLDDGAKKALRNEIAVMAQTWRVQYGDCAPLAIRYGQTLLGEHLPRRARDVKDA